MENTQQHSSSIFEKSILSLACSTGMIIRYTAVKLESFGFSSNTMYGTQRKVLIAYVWPSSSGSVEGEREREREVHVWQ